VRTDNSGVKIWENSYDINGANGHDIGNSIIELSDGSGFVVVGMTDLGTNNRDIFLMKLDCDGGVVWTRSYGGAGEEWGMDLIETRYGTPPSPFIPCAPGDIIVAGWTTSVNPNGFEEAYLMRVGPLGNVLWGASYNTNLYSKSRFISLAEPRRYIVPGTGAALEDVVAVGASDLQIGRNIDGLIVRVDANTGTYVNPTYHYGCVYGSCVTTYPGVDNCTDTAIVCGAELFTSICELTMGPGVPNDLAVAGYTTAYAPKDIYLLRLPTGLPGVAGPQTVIGDASLCGQYDDYAYTIREIPAGVNQNLTGHLAVTGVTNLLKFTSSDRDAFLMTVDPATMVPGAVDIKKRYGKSVNSTDDEEGWSVSPVLSAGNIGFIIAGTTYSNPECLNPADPSDMYLVKTDANGQSTAACTFDYQPSSRSITWNPTASTSVTSATWSANRPTSGQDQDWGAEGCSGCWLGRINGSGNNGDQYLPAPGRILDQTVRSVPNPVRRNSPIELRFDSGENQTIRISVTNALGESIYRDTRTGAGSDTRLSVETEGWPAGIYTVTLDNGGSIQRVRVVVSE